MKLYLYRHPALFHLFTKFDHSRPSRHFRQENDTLPGTKDEYQLLSSMAKFTFIAAVAVLLSAVVARDAVKAEVCCRRALQQCRSQKAPGCVWYKGDSFCIEETSDWGCKNECRKLMNQGDNFFLYTAYKGSPPLCFCTGLDAKRETDDSCLP
ncbi:hypothetical protein GMOD_00010199 [Pyrenophora seminiperda CCB06]|uniref:Uncharacterized protein n=1 Tax=Pyrenophora seminiperda CCB06 TaxID=1302712 RepID=A0A3M7M5K2_9PLEO|nr:hypothetical protein GMOD_00010199 [Pyrenophora seminiperda CCB06]